MRYFFFKWKLNIKQITSHRCYPNSSNLWNYSLSWHNSVQFCTDFSQGSWVHTILHLWQRLPKGPMLKRVPKGPRLTKGTSRIFVIFSCFWEGPGRFGDSQEMPLMHKHKKTDLYTENFAPYLFVQKLVHEEQEEEYLGSSEQEEEEEEEWEEEIAKVRMRRSSSTILCQILKATEN